MTDNFALFNVPRRPWLDEGTLKEKFLQLSAEVHPDRIHNAPAAEKAASSQRFAELNAAYNCLRESRERLRHLLELELGRKPSDLTNVPDNMMELFFSLGKTFREADAFLAEKARAKSPMVQVQLFQRGQEWVEKLSSLRQEVAARRDALITEIQSMSVNWESLTDKPLEKIQEFWRLLSFYDRWLAQIQERIVQLSF